MSIVHRAVAIVRSKKTVFLLLAIMVVAIFLRTYRFDSWLTFSPDQARDATVVGNALDGRSSLTLLGPQAGNTQFFLGPLYYEIQYVSALLFGNSPQAMAYFDLLLSVLAIPLFFVLLRKYFTAEISLLLVLLMSVSYFAISFSRFASNPNTAPFVVILFLLASLKMLDKDDRYQFAWPGLLGISIGIGMQLHTLLLFIMPTVAAIVFAYWVRTRRFDWKKVALVLFFVALLNTGQLMHEMQTGWSNSRALFNESTAATKGEGDTFVRDVKLAVACQLQANVHMISSLENDEECAKLYTVSGFSRKIKHEREFIPLLLEVICGALFTLGGYLLFGYALKRERDQKKKTFLRLMAVNTVVSLAFFMLVAGQVDMRFFIMLLPIPFLLLGFWLEFITKHYGKKGKIAAFMIVALLVVSNLWVVFSEASKYQRGIASTDRISVLEDDKKMADFVSMNAVTDQEGVNYFGGDKNYVKRFYKPVSYFTQKKDIELIVFRGKESLNQADRYFYITKADPALNVGHVIEGRKIVAFKQFGNIEIFLLDSRIGLN